MVYDTTPPWLIHENPYLTVCLLVGQIFNNVTNSAFGKKQGNWFWTYAPTVNNQKIRQNVGKKPSSFQILENKQFIEVIPEERESNKVIL